MMAGHEVSGHVLRFSLRQQDGDGVPGAIPRPNDRPVFVASLVCGGFVCGNVGISRMCKPGDFGNGDGLISAVPFSIMSIRAGISPAHVGVALMVRAISFPSIGWGWPGEDAPHLRRDRPPPTEGGESRQDPARSRPTHAQPLAASMGRTARTALALVLLRGRRPHYGGAALPCRLGASAPVILSADQSRAKGKARPEGSP